MLDSVEWGEFNFDKFFTLCTVKNKLTKFDLDERGSIAVYSSDSRNNGVIGYTNIESEFIVSEDNPVYIIFGDHTRTFNIVTNDFCVADNVKVLLPKNKYSISLLLYIISSWRKNIPNKGYARHWSLARKVFFDLPIIDNNKIDFNFMEDFITKLENEKIQELEAYLKASNIKDYHLTNEEQKVLGDFESGKVKWEEFKLGDLFEKLKTKKLPFKAKELPTEPKGIYNLPCLTSSFNNQGLNYYAPKDNATILKNVISIPSNSDIYRAYFQSKEFTVLSDAYAISWIYDNKKLSHNQYLFTVPCINKVTDLSIYSYKNKLGGWNVVRNKHILLPTKNNKPNYKLMDTLISAIQKLVIKDVVLYTRKKLGTL